MPVDPSAATAAEPSRPASAGGAATIGESLGKYRLERVLGSGGMGVVWAAFDPDLERAVAIKLLHSSDVPTLRSRLLREARAMARLKHPNVLTVYDVGTDRNRDYIAMEIVDGTTLDAWLQARPPQAEVIDALLGAGRGLAAAHAAGLVHRDFKPHNVLRSTAGHVYVTDFGLARGHIEDGPEPALASVEVASRRPLDVLVGPLTQTGVMIGTPAYMAPEQFAGGTPDARSDQFAFCVTAWEALAGERPFHGDTLPELERAVSDGARTLPPAPAMPPRIRAVLARGLEASPAARWPDLPTLLGELEAATRAAPATPAPSRTWMWVVGATVLAFAAISGGLAIFGGGSSRPPLPPLPPPAPNLGVVVVAGASDDCKLAAERQMATVWNVDKRTRVMKDAGTKALPHVYLLDDIRRRWLHEYMATCSRPASPESELKLACLRELREHIQRLADDLVSVDTRVSIAEIALLSIQSCGDKGAEIEEVEGPEPPEPPEPPASP